MSTSTEAATATGRPANPLWGLSLVAGILWTLWGLLVLSIRPGALLSVAILIGISFILGGIGQFLIATRVDSWKWLWYLLGVIGIIAGIVVFFRPGQSFYVIAVFVAWYLVISGVFTIVSAFVSPKTDWWWLALVVGVIEILLGMWAIGSPGREVLLLINLIGIGMVFFGINEIFASFASRKSAKA